MFSGFGFVGNRRNDRCGLDSRSNSPVPNDGATSVPSMTHFLETRFYMMKHVWISDELRGGDRRLKRRWVDSIWQGIAFRLTEIRRSLGTPEIVFQTSIKFRLQVVYLFVLFVKKMIRFPRTSFVITHSRTACSVFITPSQQLQQ